MSSSALLREVEVQGRTLPYMLSLADQPTGAPLLLRFHGWGGNVPPQDLSLTSTGRAGWNILAPFDRYGWNRQGCWWLGEDGNFFMLDLIDAMLNTVRSEFDLRGQLYTYGSSMGGFGAALHGFRHRCPVIVLNVPQTKITGNNYGTYHAPKLAPIFGEAFAKINDPSKYEGYREARLLSDVGAYLLELPQDYRPTIYIFQTRFDPSDNDKEHANMYLRAQTLSFVDTLVSRNVPFELYVENKKAHYVRWSWLDAIDMIEQTLEDSFE